MQTLKLNGIFKLVVAALALSFLLASCSSSNKAFGKSVKKCDGKRGISTPMGPM